MILPIILVAALIIETCLLIYTAFSADKASKNAENYKFRFESLHNQHNSLLLEKSNLKMQNLTLANENKELREALTLASQRLAFVDNEQQERFGSLRKSSAEEAERCEKAAKERLPEGAATNRYDCEGYNFPEGTSQWKLQQECDTSAFGLRVYRKGGICYICVAMGNAYGVDIGDTWFVELKCGLEIYVIRADYQHDITKPDPDDFGERYEYDKDGNIVGPLRNYDGEECVHVLEFIADLDKLPQEAKDAGGMHGVDFFGGKYGAGGNIVKMKYLGRKWEP